MEKNQSLVCVKENIFVKIGRFIKNIFSKDIVKIDDKHQEEVKLEIVTEKNTKHSKEELLEIYSKAKEGKYDLNMLELEEIMILINLIEEEIKIKTEKLEEIRAQKAS